GPLMRLATILAACALALPAPAAASAATFGELPFTTLPGGVSCVRATGAPGQLVTWAPTGARLERAPSAGLTRDAAPALGRAGCPAVATRPDGAGVAAAPTHGAIGLALRDPGGDWKAAPSIPLEKDGVASDVEVAVAPSGEAVVAWSEFDRQGASVVRVARR